MAEFKGEGEVKTIQDLYNWAKSRGLENAPFGLIYQNEDSWENEDTFGNERWCLEYSAEVEVRQRKYYDGPSYKKVGKTVDYVCLR